MGWRQDLLEETADERLESLIAQEREAVREGQGLSAHQLEQRLEETRSKERLEGFSMAALSPEQQAWIWQLLSSSWRCLGC